MKSGQRWRNDLFGTYVAPNFTSHGRLGVVVSRKTSPRAVIRNRVKRQIRESFRHNQERFGGLSIVVLANPKAGAAKLEALRLALQQLWDTIEKQCKKS